MQKALKHGYNRLNKPQPSEARIDNLIWQTIRKKEACYTKDELDHWMLDFACIQLSVNLHDWRHRKSCFKSGRTKCRYGIPSLPRNRTEVTAVFTQPSTTTNAINQPDKSPQSKSQIKELHIDVKKRSPSTFLTDSNSPIMSVINCNNCAKYVRDQKVSMYYGAYTTKHSTDCEKALAEAMLAIEKHENRVRKQQEQADKDKERYQREQEMQEDNMEQPQLPTSRRSDYSIGLGKLLAAIRAATNGDTIGGPLAAFVLLGNDIFAMSHKTVPLSLTQAIAYVEQQNIYATITRFGEVKATIHDYVFRATRNQDIEAMNFWTFVKTQESCKLSPEKRNRPSNDDDDNEDEPEHGENREINRFTNGHPQHATQGHRARTNVHWTKNLAKRLPDLDDLEDNSNLTSEEREQRREEYAKKVLIMFVPLRKKTDLVNEGETWWDAYKRHKRIMYSNQDTKITIDSIQNFYESFCRPSPETQALDFTRTKILASL